MRQKVTDITDLRQISLSSDVELLKKEWQYKPVRVTGVIDNEQEIKI